MFSITLMSPGPLLALLAALPIAATVKTLLSYFVASRLPQQLLAGDLRDRHVLISGASKGLGRVLAAQCAVAGCASVTLIARGKEALDEAVKEVKKAVADAKVSTKVIGVACDAANLDAVVAAFESVRAQGGGWDWLVANAGASHPGFLADQLESHTAEGMISTNYDTALNLVRASLIHAKRLAPIPTGDDVVGLRGAQMLGVPQRVIVVGSVLSVMSFVGYSAYAASKYALRGLTDSLRSELLPFGTSVHLYIAANMDTPGFANENKTKPAVTAKIEGTASTLTPRDAASILLAGVVNGRYMIANDIVGELVRVLANGASPRPNPITEAIALPLISIIMTIWLYFADQDVISTYKNVKRPRVLPSELKKAK